MPRDLVVIDPPTLRAALDGRTQTWLANRTGINRILICRMLRPPHSPKPYLAPRATYERMRAALPSLPPPPEPSNGHGKEEAYDSPLESGNGATTSTEL